MQGYWGQKQSAWPSLRDVVSFGTYQVALLKVNRSRFKEVKIALLGHTKVASLKRSIGQG